jgi:hypothetical protein
MATLPPDQARRFLKEVPPPFLFLIYIYIYTVVCEIVTTTCIAGRRGCLAAEGHPSAGRVAR